MNRFAQEALLARLARRLFEHDSWAGETHLQKATYLLRELTGVPFDFDFILYKHGPFSFELRDELGSMRVDGLLERRPQPAPYGPRFLVTDRGRELEGWFSKTTEQYRSAVDWIADRLDGRGVSSLERLATALWVSRQLASHPVEERAEALRRIKPHISEESALEAVAEIDKMMQEAPTVR